MRKKTYWVFFWKGCICQLHTVYKKDCSFIMRFQSCSIYIIHKSLNFSTNYLVELYVSSQMCSSVRSDFDLPPTPSLHAGTKSAWYPFVAMWEAGKLLSSKCTVSERVLCILLPVCLHQSVSNGGKASEEENTSGRKKSFRQVLDPVLCLSHDRCDKIWQLIKRMSVSLFS